MVQLNHRPPRRRFDDIPRQSAVEFPRQRAVQQPEPARRHSHWRMLRYQLLIIKVRIKVFFIKAKRRPVRSGAILAALVLAVTGGMIFYPRKAQSITELEYFQQQLDDIKESIQFVKNQNPTTTDVSALSNQIEDYKNSLIDSLGTCDRIDTQAEQINKQVMKDYLQAVEHARQFCNDYEDVADYARKVSKSTKQFIVFPSDSITNTPNASSVNDLIEIIGYTQNDLKKLNGGPLDDPALEEMIITIDNLSKLALETQKSPTEINLQKLAKETQAQQANLLRARVYFWNNTIKIDPLSRSLVRLRAEFNTK